MEYPFVQPRIVEQAISAAPKIARIPHSPVNKTAYLMLDNIRATISVCGAKLNNQ